MAEEGCRQGRGRTGEEQAQAQLEPSELQRQQTFFDFLGLWGRYCF